jgi:hypothetical protein
MNLAKALSIIVGIPAILWLSWLTTPEETAATLLVVMCSHWWRLKGRKEEEVE